MQGLRGIKKRHLMRCLIGSNEKKLCYSFRGRGRVLAGSTSKR